MRGVDRPDDEPADAGGVDLGGDEDDGGGSEETGVDYARPLAGALIGLALAQGWVGLEHSIDVAGFDKQLFARGEWWRLVTGGLIHGGGFHVLCNAAAMYSLGGVMQRLADPRHLPAVFLVANVVGGICSAGIHPTGVSVGASGGLCGMLAFLGVATYRYRARLNPGMVKAVYQNIAFIALIGLAFSAYIDNAAHAGGAVAGAVHAAVACPPRADLPVGAGFATTLGPTAAGVIAVAILGTVALVLGS